MTINGNLDRKKDGASLVFEKMESFKNDEKRGVRRDSLE
jgi:hypothetical protein